jgi:hypothetical protein
MSGGLKYWFQSESGNFKYFTFEFEFTLQFVKAGIYVFLYVFNCNILIKYVTITQNR